MTSCVWFVFLPMLLQLFQWQPYGQCVCHSHLCHILTFSWVIFRISGLWIINTLAYKRRGQDRESQCVTALTHRKVTNKQISCCILFHFSWGSDASLTESHSLHFYSIWSCGPYQQLTLDIWWAHVGHKPVCRMVSQLEDILTEEGNIFNISFLNWLCLDTCVFSLPWRHTCYIDDLRDTVVCSAVKTTLSKDYLHFVNIHTNTHLQTMAFWVPKETLSSLWFSLSL